MDTDKMTADEFATWFGPSRSIAEIERAIAARDEAIREARREECTKAYREWNRSGKSCSAADACDAIRSAGKPRFALGQLVRWRGSVTCHKGDVMKQAAMPRQWDEEGITHNEYPPVEVRPLPSPSREGVQQSERYI